MSSGPQLGIQRPGKSSLLAHAEMCELGLPQQLGVLAGVPKAIALATRPSSETGLGSAWGTGLLRDRPGGAGKDGFQTPGPQAASAHSAKL